MPFLRAVAVCALLFFPIATFAVDLTKIDRTIAKQPAYRGKPKYCLLVFGPEAKTRIWLVQDGDTLYVDRTSNGDLTGPAKKVVADNGAEPMARTTLKLATSATVHWFTKLFQYQSSNWPTRGSLSPMSA